MKIKNEIIKEMKDYTEVNRKETFLILKDNKITFCNLKTLNYLANELKLNFKILANCNWSRGCNKAIINFETWK